MKKLFLFLFTSFIIFHSMAQPLVISGVSVNGRFNSCSGSNLPNITANLISTGSGSSVSGGVFNCFDPCATSVIRVVMSNIKWNKQPNNEWLHGLFLPANLGFSVVPITIPNGFIAYNAGCVGLCPSGSGLNNGPGFYYDNTADNSCCGTVLANDGIPCNNFGNVNIGCGASLSLTFDLTFCNSLITGSSYQFVFTGSSDGESGCYFLNDGNTHQIKFSISTNPCSSTPINPIASPVVRSCSSGSLNYTSSLSGNCTGNNIYWWNAATGGTLLGTGSPFIYDPAGSACPAGTTLYATCCNGASTNCVARVPVTIAGNCNVISISGATFVDETCSSLGSINALFVQNAQGTLSYTLNPGGITSSSGVFNGLSAGNYTVSVKDTTDCEAIMVISIGAPPVLNWSSVSSSDVTCSGFSNGFINCTASGGAGTYNYDLLPAGVSNNTGSFNALSGGNYTVVATDGSGCSVTTNIIIIDPAPFAWTLTNMSPPSCSGMSDGSIQVQATGGVSSLQYLLNPGATNSLTGNYTSLAAGTYSIQVTDGNACSANTVITISQPSSLLMNVPSLSNPLCNAGLNGSITITASGGTGVITYQLMPGSSTNTNGNFVGLNAGIYTITASDVNACSTSTILQLNNPIALSWNSILLSHLNCYNDNNGQINLTATGGTGLITYTLTPSGTINTSGNFNGLAANAYTVTASDVNGCSISTSISISQPAQLVWTSTTTFPVLCFGGLNGSLNAVAIGGTGTLSYTLQPGGINNSTGTFSGLGAGTYTVVLTDANNCTKQTTLTITQPNALSWSTVNSTQVSCFGGNNGTINASISGGSGSINYTLLPAGLSNTSGIFTGLSFANYTVQAIDANGCSLTTSLIVNQAPQLSITNVLSTTPSCVPGNDATLTITANGGTGSYQYNLGGANQSSNVFNNVAAGIYTITVIDANACTSFSIVNIQAPFSPTINSVTITPVICYGDNSASANVSASGGTGLLNYTLSPGGILNSSGNFTSLVAGNYSITVSDANGCAVNTSFSITQPNQIIWSSTNTTPVLCFGGSNGSLNAIASGGTGAMTYQLQPGGIINSSGIYNGLNAGVYTIQVVDANNCTKTTTLTISQSSALVFNSISITPVSCFGGSNGNINISTLGGSGSINFLLLPSGVINSSGNFSGISSGIYTIQATDANACSISTILQVNQASLLTINAISSTTPSCIPGNDAIVSVTASGGTGTYQYSIGGANQASNVFNNVGTGIYTITVTDANACTATSTLQIITPNAPIISGVSINNASCNPGNDGSVSILVSGGLGPYTYSSTGIIFQTSNLLNGLAAGNYTVVVKDANGCTVNSLVTVGSLVSPNITSVNTTQASCIPGCDGTATINATGGTSGIFQYSLIGGSYQNSNTFSLLCTNTYTVIVLDGNGCTDSETFNISTANGPNVASSLVNNVSCKSGTNGSIVVSASSGTPTYTYTLEPGGITNSTGIFNLLTANNYTISISDANACSINTNFVITEPDSLLFNNLLANPLSCYGLSNGSIVAPTTGGTGSLTYSINPTAIFTAPNTFSGLGGGIYTVTASDVNNCSITQSVLITEPSAVSISNLTTTNISCFGLNNGSINLNAAGGTGSLSYLLQPGGITNSSGLFNGLAAGNYTIQVIDANNCSTSTSTQIIEPIAISIDSLILTSVSCNNLLDGEIFISASGGIGNSQYSLQPGSIVNSSGVFSGLGGNSYTISIIDSNACAADTSILLLNPNALSISGLASNNVLCFGDSNGSIQVSVIGGTGSISYTIYPSLVNNASGNFNGLTSGVFTIVASDANNCSLSTSIAITEAAPISLNLVSQQNITCFNGNDGSIQVNAIGGIPPYLFTLQPFGTTNGSGLFSNLTSTIYTILVSDSNSCITSLAPIVLNQAPPIVWSNINVQNINCFGDTDGNISVSASGGIGNLNYVIAPNIGSQLSPGNFTSLIAGGYTITCTDINFCSISTIITITQSPAIVISSLQLVGPSCFGDANGLINVTAAGGNSPYSYQLNGSSAIAVGSFTNLNAGMYSLSITDASGCKLDTLLQLISPAILTIAELTIYPENCENSNDAKINVVASGGNGQYYFTLNPGNITNQTGSFTNLITGTYSLHIKDSSGCSVDTLFTIYPLKEPLRLTVTKQDLSCVGSGNQGWAEAIVQGGTPPINYEWNTSPVQITSKASGLYFGYYMVEVSDANGCKLKDTIYIEPGPCCEELFVPNAFSPNDDGLNDVFRITTTAGIQLAQFAIYDRWGKKVWQTTDYKESWDGTYDGSTTTSQTFYYIFRYKCLTDGRSYMRTGDILLIK